MQPARFDVQAITATGRRGATLTAVEPRIAARVCKSILAVVCSHSPVATARSEIAMLSGIDASNLQANVSPDEASLAELANELDRLGFDWRAYASKEYKQLVDGLRDGHSSAESLPSSVLT